MNRKLLCSLIISLLSFSLQALSAEKYENYDLISNFKEGKFTNFKGNLHIDNGFKIKKNPRVPDDLKEVLKTLFKNSSTILSNQKSAPFRKEDVWYGGISIDIPPRVNGDSSLAVKFNKKDESCFTEAIISIRKHGRIVLNHKNGDKVNEIAKTDMNLKTNEKHKLYLLFFHNNIVLIKDDKILLYAADPTRKGHGDFEVNPAELKNTGKLKIQFCKYPNATAKILTSLVMDCLKWNNCSIKHAFPAKEHAPKNMVHIYRNYTSRRAIAMPVGSKMEYNAVIPSGAFLDFEYLFLAYQTKIEEGLFLKLKVKDTTNKVLFEKDLKCPSGTGWRYTKSDLGDLEGQKVRISLSLQRDKTAASDKDTVLFLANPVLRSKREPDDLNVLLISLDTLRADHVGTYGYRRNTTPNLDRLAREGVVFQNAISHAPWTLPSHISLFTSLYPLESGHKFGFSFPYSAKALNTSRLLPELNTLPELLKQGGYKTLATTGAGYVASFYGFDQGFEVYRNVPGKSAQGISRQTQYALNWIKRNKGQKWFIFYHTFEIHEPYTRRFFKPDASDGEAAGMIANYDSGIRYADYEIGILLNNLRAEKLLEKTVVIVLSDHGESFYDHRTGKLEDPEHGRHGHTLFDDQIHIPMIIGGPKEVSKKLKIKDQVRMVDILPTILDLTGNNVPKQIRGRSLVPLINGKIGQKRVAYSEALYVENPENESKALRTNQYKLIYNGITGKSREKIEFYDLTSDPLEKRNLSERQLYQRNIYIYSNLLVRTLKSITLNRSKLTWNTEDTGLPLRELRQQLQSLGYLGN